RGALGGWAQRRTGRRGAAVAVVAAMALLAGAAAGMRLDPTVIGGLPPGASAARAASAAAEGFPPGIVAPSVVLVRGPGVTDAAARSLQGALAGAPGVADVLGPATPRQLGLAPGPRGVFVTRGAGIARYLLLLDHDPVGPTAIADLRRLQDRLPAMLAAAGMPDATASVGGDTAVASEALRATRDDLLRVGAVAVVAILVILALTLGSLVAPLVLVGGIVLALIAAVGAATLAIQGAAGAAGVQYFVPFAAAVLLLSLGADYGVYMLRAIGERSRTMPPAAAVTEALRASAGPITLAAAILAGSFALLAIVPLDAFREFAVAMVIGIALAAVVVPMIVVPWALTVIARRPAQRGRTVPVRVRAPLRDERDG
ncbi:MAG TPA: MMPL family transporter, partial [Miltoncostaea sp.]|nr:MMPL family transporter [Miltoncostaea sp.]